jgi:hypothetical protein
VKCKLCDETLSDNLTLREPSGYIQYVDENNIIRHNHITKEHASTIGSGTHLSKKDKADADALSEAIAGVVVNDDDPRADALRILIKQLSRSASKDAASSLKAVELALQLVGERGGMKSPRAGERCPLCKRDDKPYPALNLSRGSAERVLYLLTKLKDAQDEPDKV